MTMPTTYEVVALLGPDGAGKSTLARAVAEVASRWDPSVVHRPIEVQGRSATVVDIRTPRAIRQLADFADAATEAALLGVSRASSAILVVAAVDSIMPAHRTSLANARQLGVGLLAVALTKCDVAEDEELLDLVELEIGEFLSREGFGYAPIVRIPARRTRPREREGREPEPRGPEGVEGLLSILSR